MKYFILYIVHVRIKNCKETKQFHFSPGKKVNVEITQVIISMLTKRSQKVIFSDQVIHMN